MEFPLTFRAANPATTTFLGSKCGVTLYDVAGLSMKKKKSRKKMKQLVEVVRVTATAERGSGREAVDGGGAERESSSGGGYTSSAMEVTTFNQRFRSAETEFPLWEKIGAVVRLSYGIGIYVAMALAGRFICSMTGIDSSGGFDPSLDAIVEGLGYAAPPIMALLFILDDEVVKLSPHARAIRDVEDEELRSFFYGMSPWQFILIVAASSVGEELFYRAAVQGALADIFLRSTDLLTDARGMASMTGFLPPFVPFAQVFAAVVTAALTGSLYYVAASPKDPTYVVAPVLQSRSRREDLKKLFAGASSLPFQKCVPTFWRLQNVAKEQRGKLKFAAYFACIKPLSIVGCLSCIIKHASYNCKSDYGAYGTAWYERRQMKKIYSPLLEAILALYLGFEWIQTNNIFAPILTHGIYSAVVLGHGLWKIHDHRRRLRQRVQQLKLEEKSTRNL